MLMLIKGYIAMNVWTICLIPILHSQASKEGYPVPLQLRDEDVALTAHIDKVVESCMFEALAAVYSYMAASMVVLVSQKLNLDSQGVAWPILRESYCLCCY